MINVRSRQTGVAMVIGLVMLILLTLMVVSAINSGTIGLKIAGNVQAQDEARAAAQQAIEQYVSVYANFVPTPLAKAATGYDINNDGTNDYTVTIAAPTCKRAAKQIPPRSASCATGAKSGLFCYDTIWEVSATAVNTSSGVSQTVVQGVALTFPPSFNVTTLGC